MSAAARNRRATPTLFRTDPAMQSLWMLFASFVFAIMGVCVKLASSYYSTSEIVLYRGLVGIIFILCLIRLRGGTLKTTLVRQHFWRGAIGVSSLWMWFYSLGKLPLATAMTLNYMSPIWMALILFIGGWWRAKSRFDWGLLCAIGFSFIGVTLLLRPAIHSDQWLGSSLALVSGALSALAYLQVRQLGQLGEPEYRVVFYFSLTGMAAGLLGFFVLPGNHSSLWHAHSAKGMALLLTIGVTATIAQMAMTRAYRLGKTLVTANLQYTGIVFSSLWGILIWHDVLGGLGWLGIGVILFSGLAATFYNTRNSLAASKAAADAKPIANEAQT